MLKYNLLGQAVTFEDSAERYFDLQFAAEQAGLAVSQRFNEWYKQCGNIQSALDGYLPFSESVVEELAFRPLFAQLAQCEIYDMSEEHYWKRCIGLGESDTALETVERQYNAILKQQNAEKEYRANRKAGRSRWSGGGFGMSGALEGAGQAASLNAVSGLGHSVFNAIGNVGSAISASMDKSALYKNPATQDTLLNGIIADLFTAYSAHMDFLNERKKNYVQSVFDKDKSSALFENAKKLPEKENELLVQSFALCPWNNALVRYIFIHFPEERKTIYAAAQRFSIDLRDSVEDILAQEYDGPAQSSEANAQAARERILNHMREYGVSESATLNRLETDCLRRLCEGYQTADEAACEQLMEKVRRYQAQEKLKGPFFEQLHKWIEDIWTSELEQICQGLDTADEASCNLRMEKIAQHKAPKDMKTPFQQKLRQRIQAIWTEELTGICQGADTEAACRQRINAINNHKAPDSFKAPYVESMEKQIRATWTKELTQICQGYETADEAACDGFITAIKAHKAPDRLKAPFLQKVQTRIESIWSAEDGEIFDNLYMKTDITDPKAVAEAVTYVQSKGRTSSSQKYLDALNACAPKNIENARLHQNTNRYKLYMILAILCVLPIITLPLTVLLFVKAWSMKKAWKLLTMNGTMIHPTLLSVQPDTKSSK